MGSLNRYRAAISNFVLPILLAWIVVGAVHRRFYRPPTKSQAVAVASYGPMKLRLRLPGTAAEIPEPLVVCGRPGDASLVYIRLFKNARARVGVEFWGLGAFESDKFALPAADAQVDVICSVPAFFPKEGDPDWQATPRAEQRLKSHRYTITVDGVLRLQGSVDYDMPRHSPLYVGLNPVGGSLVSAGFTGKILEASQVSPVSASDGGRHD